MNLKFRGTLMLTCVLMFLSPAANAAENTKASPVETEDESPSADGITSAVLQTQVLLDRLLFSPGPIDGLVGRNYKLALKAYQNAKGLNASGEMDEETSKTLRESAQVTDFLHSYTITEADASSDFIESVPEDAPKQAEFDALSLTQRLTRCWRSVSIRRPKPWLILIQVRSGTAATLSRFLMSSRH